jgi:hypothetical protein
MKPTGVPVHPYRRDDTRQAMRNEHARLLWNKLNDGLELERHLVAVGGPTAAAVDDTLNHRTALPRHMDDRAVAGSRLQQRADRRLQMRLQDDHSLGPLCGEGRKVTSCSTLQGRLRRPCSEPHRSSVRVVGFGVATGGGSLGGRRGPAAMAADATRLQDRWTAGDSAAPGRDRALDSMKNLEALIEDGGDITVGPIGPIECAATAADSHNALAMLVRRDGETLNVRLKSLDRAIARYY